MKEKEFRVKVVEINGKKELLIEVQSEEIIHENGRKDVIIHAPSLDLIKKIYSSTSMEG